EDELAIHTVASAAFRVLRDVTTKRGRNFTADVLRAGVYVLAKRHAEGKLSERELKLIEKTPLMDSIRQISDAIKVEGDRFDRDKIAIPMSGRAEQRAWPTKAANFLKHAERDTDDLLAIDDLNNENVLIGACVSYLQLMQNATPEMMAYMAYWAVKNGGEYDVPNAGRELAIALGRVGALQRPALCLDFIAKLKNS